MGDIKGGTICGETGLTKKQARKAIQRVEKIPGRAKRVMLKPPAGVFNRWGIGSTRRGSKGKNRTSLGQIPFGGQDVIVPKSLGSYFIIGTNKGE